MFITKKKKKNFTHTCSVGFCPNDRIAIPNSLVEIVPLPSLSNIINASRNSSISSGVNCKFFFFFLLSHELMTF